MTEPLLVAEIDEEGRVSCVWAHWRHGRSARPVVPGSLTPSQLRNARFSGAPKASILNWVASAGARRVEAGAA